MALSSVSLALKTLDPHHSPAWSIHRLSSRILRHAHDHLSRIGIPRHKSCFHMRDIQPPCMLKHKHPRAVYYIPLARGIFVTLECTVLSCISSKHRAHGAHPLGLKVILRTDNAWLLPSTLALAHTFTPCMHELCALLAGPEAHAQKQHHGHSTRIYALQLSQSITFMPPSHPHVLLPTWFTGVKMFFFLLFSCHHHVSWLGNSQTMLTNVQMPWFSCCLPR